MKKDMNSLTVLVPCYNESDAIELYFPKLVKFCIENEFKLIIVNDGSNDDSFEKLDKYKTDYDIIIINHKVNKGYGSAIISGIMGSNTAYTITIDSDGQHNLEDINKMYKYLVKTDSDMVVGKRISDKHSSFYRNTGKKIIKLFLNILMRVRISDLNSGMKIFRTDLAKKYLYLCPETMAFSQIFLLLFIYNKHLVNEIDVTVNKRIAGKSKIKIINAFEAIIEILHIIVLFNPLKIFLTLSLISMIVGLAWGIPIILQNRGFSVGAMLAVVTSILLFMLGLITEQLSQIRKKNRIS